MNREDIIRMAQEANRYASNQTGDSYEWHFIRDERFARSIEANVREEFTRRLNATVELAEAAEREACATFLERVVDLSHLNKHRVWQKYTADLLANCAAAIRAKGQK